MKFDWTQAKFGRQGVPHDSTLLRSELGAPLAKPEVHQSGAIPYRIDSTGEVEILLVTSSTGDRWVFPKGRIESGRSPEAQAVAESWEEAGIHGHIVGPVVGSFQYIKCGSLHVVDVYLLEVTAVAEDWPESDERRRKWVPLHRAASEHQRPEAEAIFRAALSRLILDKAQPHTAQIVSISSQAM